MQCNFHEDPQNRMKLIRGNTTGRLVMGHERENAAVDNFVYCLLVELFRCLVVEGNKDDGKRLDQKSGKE